MCLYARMLGCFGKLPLSTSSSLEKHLWDGRFLNDFSNFILEYYSYFYSSFFLLLLVGLGTYRNRRKKGEDDVKGVSPVPVIDH